MTRRIDRWIPLAAFVLATSCTDVTNSPASQDAAVAAALPPGAILPFAGPTEPEGWLLCDGSAVSRTEYAELFSVIGTAHGGGNGASTFNLPDLRGRFLRGVDQGANMDPEADARLAARPGGNIGDLVGTTQGYATAHPQNAFLAEPAGLHSHTYAAGTPAGASPPGGSNSYYAQDTNRTTVAAGMHTHAISGGDSETRPLNVAVLYIMKY